ncbi:MAG: glutathione S-transferase family protein [Phenylobacterium sp.]|uniref:glutathione S-transferase family protein n=1 Tax=Phenylobacterium sp. TaxID=1871053 RepID=UPI0027334505|nr:glutathione S-transferase family protein [Phenylobacterium sp.]MDP3748025.1 glutathione S-transferase family protein [Phenylobacterium sp.]
MTITLYEFAPTRSARVRWTLLELGVPFESIAGQEVFALPALAEIHPMSKLPALRDDGRPLFESAAICNWLADSHPDAGLIAPSGTWARALHDQWTAFTLAEVEANLWHTARNLFIYSEEERVPAVYEQNAKEAKRGLAVLDGALAGKTWLVEDRFSVTDIFVGYAVAWGHMQGITADLPHLSAYGERLLARRLCPYGAMGG